MIQTINEYQFADAFNKIRPDNFTYRGLIALYDYFEQYEEDTGEQIELDVIGLCCEYVEYEDLETFQEDYSEDYESIEEIEQATIVIMIDDDAFIIQAF